MDLFIQFCNGGNLCENIRCTMMVILDYIYRCHCCLNMQPTRSLRFSDYVLLTNIQDVLVEVIDKLISKHL